MKRHTRWLYIQGRLQACRLDLKRRTYEAAFDEAKAKFRAEYAAKGLDPEGVRVLPVCFEPLTFKALHIAELTPIVGEEISRESFHFV